LTTSEFPYIQISDGKSPAYKWTPQNLKLLRNSYDKCMRGGLRGDALWKTVTNDLRQQGDDSLSDVRWTAVRSAAKRMFREDKVRGIDEQRGG
jgi:hypothetical protein